MRQSYRKLIGTVGIVAVATIYAVLATTVAAARLADYGWVAHLLYFFLTGFLWIVPALFLVNWMMKPDRPDDGAKN